MKMNITFENYLWCGVMLLGNKVLISIAAVINMVLMLIVLSASTYK